MRWIKSWLPYGETHPAALHAEGGSTLRLELAGVPPKPPESLRRAVRRKAAWAAREPAGPRRRRRYEALERDPKVRRLALEAWGSVCQVVGCSTLAGFPAAAAPQLVDVHHLNHISVEGSDSPLNLCLLCVAHHALVHRAGSRLRSSDFTGADIEVAGEILRLVRDARLIL
ncbi:MAG TPA: hypothetical protein VE596_15725 [Gaiellaceae bacterium]|nr:hypothetical protein [Gaiellaceae bacterium]